MIAVRHVTCIWLGVIALIYLFLAGSYAQKTPAWQVPDEPAHYNYIRQIAESGRIPVIEMGDWDSDYQRLLTDTGFDPQYTDEIQRIEYEDHQPPLYYLLGMFFYRASDGDLKAIRWLSVALGLGVVLSTFWVVDGLFPDKPWLGLSAAALAAFIPQHLAMLGGVNNDPLAELLVGVTLFRVIRYLQRETTSFGDSLLLGILVGLAFLTKSTVYFLAGIVGIAILLKWRRVGWSRTNAFQHLLAYLIPALLMGGAWWIRNLDVYSGTDFLGLQRHDEVAAGQLQTQDYIEHDLNGDTGLYRKNFLYTTFHSFWGQFGWMALPMEQRVYRLLLLLCLGMLVGSLIYGWREGWLKSLLPYQRESLLLFVLTIAFVFAAYLYYNLTFVQFQGRYLYPALIPLVMWGAIGLAGWTEWLASRFPWIRWISVLVSMLLAVLAWYALDHYIVPNLPNWS
jgi:4-amino-4-deoxy-L-arabinose transferase-like glycosyltransferase